MAEVFSLEDLLTVDGLDYVEVEAMGGTFRLGSLSSHDMSEWNDSNNSTDPKVKREAGLRMLVKSIVGKDNKRVPPEKFDEYLESFRKKDNRSNGKLIAECLKLNGFDTAARLVLKNDSSEAPSNASPTDSPAS